jgi:putative aminopeptidase FrvX
MLLRRAECFAELRQRLVRHGVKLATWGDLSPAQQDEARQYFERHVSPALTPLSLNPSHPFPFMSNLSTSWGFVLKDAEAADRILVLTLGPAGQPGTLIVAPLDEDGYVVSGITEEGYLRLHRPGREPVNRLFDQYLVGQPVLIHTSRRGAVAGVTATPSTHLRRYLPADEANRIRGLEDLWVDVGASTAAQAGGLGIRVLDTVTLRERAQPLAGGRVAGPAAQSRANALALVELVRGWAAAPVPANPVTIAWMAQSVFGGRGLARLIESGRPQRIIVCGPATPARAKDADPRGGAGAIGGGPLAALGDGATHEAAAASGVTVQDVAPDRWAQRAPAGWKGPWQLLGVPVLFAQSPVETVGAADVIALAKLVAAVTGLPAPAAPATVVADPRTPAPATPPPAPAGTTGFGALRTLIETYGVSGHEEAVREVVLKVIRETVPWAKPTTDERGNVVVSFGAGGAEKVFLAHMDEIGYEIVAIRADGSATLRARGGMYDSLYEAHPVLVHAAAGRVPAVLAPRPGYAASDAASPRPEDMTAYFGATSADEVKALGLAVGDTLTVRKRFAPLAGTRATGRSMDDRSGVAILLSALAKINPALATGKTTFVWSVAEETGLIGATFVASKTTPFAAFAVDTFVSTDGPFDTRRLAYAPLGQGAVLRGMDSSTNTPPALVDRLVALAGRLGIPMHIGITAGGTDASPFSRYGAMDVGLSWPGRYSHSPVEVIDQRDFDAVIRLVVAVATSRW